MKTVLVATGIMNAGGTETLIMELLRHQTGKVRYIMLIHYAGEITKGVFDDEIRDLNVPIVYIKSVSDLGIKGYCHEFKKVVSEIGPVDIIHSHLNAIGGIICMAAKQVGIKHRICHCHANICFNSGLIHRLKQETMLQISRILISIYGTQFWACSYEAWKRLFYPWKKKVVIPNIIDVGKYLSQPSEHEAAKAVIGMSGKLVIGSVGRVAHIKNYELALQIVACLKRRGVEVHFVCYGRFDAQGDVYCAELLAMAGELGIANRVHFMGNTNQVFKDIKAFDVFLMTSRTEGFGMAAIEAQAAGIPSLLSVGIPRIVDIEAGYVTFLPFENVDVWADAVIKASVATTPANDTIVECFEKKGYNSVTRVKWIEEQYVDLRD